MGKDKKKQQPKGPRVLHMTADEQANLAGRDGMMGQYEYLAKLIQRDIQTYINERIKPRMGLKLDQRVNFNIDAGTITVIEEPKMEVQKDVAK